MACSPITKPVTYTSLTSTNPIYARVNTSMGNFEVELFPASAPKTVSNFVSLVESGFYDNLVWHRIESNVSPYVIQTGDPLTRCGLGDRSDWGEGGSNVTVPLEIDKSLHNYAGYLGMARGVANNSGTSQFYINIQNNTTLDGRYTVFGKVVSGMSVVDELAAVQTSSQYSEQPLDVGQTMLLSITILNGP